MQYNNVKQPISRRARTNSYHTQGSKSLRLAHFLCRDNRTHFTNSHFQIRIQQVLSLKIAIPLVLSLTAVGFATTARWSREPAAAHPSLATAKQPALIPEWNFYADMWAKWVFRSSCNDRYLAWRATRKTNEWCWSKTPTTTARSCASRT